ncbi:SRPBCC family protein [Corynebacterium kalidii]
MAYEISDSVTIAASPAEVYDLVSDVTRTGEWSAQCRRAEWDSDDRGDGATFTGHNHRDGREWSTVSEVTAARPGEEFSWRVTSSGTRWGFRMEPVNRREDATVLTEFTAFTGEGEAYFRQKFGDDAAAQEADRRNAATYGITDTLQNIKGILEG